MLIKSLQLSLKDFAHQFQIHTRPIDVLVFQNAQNMPEAIRFLIPYNRQQLADYLNVDRSTMCNELSKMQKDDMIEYKKNRILLKD